MIIVASSTMMAKKAEGLMEGGVEVDGCGEEIFTESIQTLNDSRDESRQKPYSCYLF